MFRTFKTFDRLEKRYTLVNEADEEETDDTEAEAPEDDDVDMGEDEDTGGDMPDEAMDMEGGEPMPDEGGDDMDADLGGADEADPENDPNAQADVDAGTFVSDIKKAEFAETLLRALKTPVPPAGQIPAQYQNVTTQNADEVINFVTNFVTLDTALAQTDDSEIVDALKGV